jgi:hypothetical protein
MPDLARLPPLPTRQTITDVCEEVAAREHLEAIAVEKDF